MTTNTLVYRAMNTTFELKLDSKHEISTDFFTKVISETERLEQIMSRFRETSELTSLNRNLNHWNHVSETMYDVLRKTEKKWVETNGAFDPRVLAYLDLLGYSGAEVAPSTSREDALFDWKTDGRVKFSAPIDLGGIGKGYAADYLSTLIELECRDEWTGYIINAGGDMIVCGTQADGSAWNVGVEDPIHASNDLALVLSISGEKTAICTSSTWKRRWERENQTFHHLINPWTKLPYQGNVVSVTAFAESCVDAEVYTKSLFIQDEQNDIHLPYLPHISINAKKEIVCSNEIASTIIWTFTDFHRKENIFYVFCD
jgi:thiamine biosynthesis lipoprotein